MLFDDAGLGPSATRFGDHIYPYPKPIGSGCQAQYTDLTIPGQHFGCPAIRFFQYIHDGSEKKSGRWTCSPPYQSIKTMLYQAGRSLPSVSNSTLKPSGFNVSPISMP